MILKYVIARLNWHLNADHFDRDDFCKLISILFKQLRVKIWMMDFEHYDSKLREDTATKKNEAMNSQDFECASIYRGIERKCEEYIKFKNDQNIKKSVFYKEGNSLFYF